MTFPEACEGGSAGFVVFASGGVGPVGVVAGTGVVVAAGVAKDGPGAEEVEKPLPEAGEKGHGRYCSVN